MANMTWSPRRRNCKVCRNWDDMHADVSLKCRALPHKSGCSLFQEAVYCAAWRRLVGISFISHSFQSWILFHSCYLQSKLVNLSQQYNYDIKINYRKSREEKASFFQRKLLKATISNPVFSQAITKAGAPSCSGLTHAQTRGFTLVYVFLYWLCLQKGQLSVLNWYPSDLNQCSEKPLQSQTWANWEKFTFTGKNHLPPAGWKGWCFYYGMHCHGRWKTSQDRLSSSSQISISNARRSLHSGAYSSSYTASPDSLMQLLLLLGMFSFRTKP